MSVYGVLRSSHNTMRAEKKRVNSFGSTFCMCSIRLVAWHFVRIPLTFRTSAFLLRMRSCQVKSVDLQKSRAAKATVFVLDVNVICHTLSTTIIHQYVLIRWKHSQYSSRFMLVLALLFGSASSFIFSLSEQRKRSLGYYRHRRPSVVNACAIHHYQSYLMCPLFAIDSGQCAAAKLHKLEIFHAALIDWSDSHPRIQ